MRISLRCICRTVELPRVFGEYVCLVLTPLTTWLAIPYLHRLPGPGRTSCDFCHHLSSEQNLGYLLYNIGIPLPSYMIIITSHEIRIPMNHVVARCSMYGLFTYIKVKNGYIQWEIFLGKYFPVPMEHLGYNKWGILGL